MLFKQIKAFFTLEPLSVLHGVESFSPLAPQEATRDVVAKIESLGLALEQMPADSWTDATCQFVVEGE